MTDKLPTPQDMAEAIFSLSLSQMRSIAIMQSVLEQYHEQMSPEARERIEQSLGESFETADKINTRFAEFEW
ncbi:hypothetical protein J2D73_12570 [Acetobacter sacchari]|uniref:Uncharacterized protein n=1 Tax=Acetobacter sacchari TaxID=2661687 RepID=A0ABS3LXH5_9PROT|nr:hypothetical protein [Acetobacter sacchari]MBO1360622.1 hypothetical protein [Acetobacter sacchari]